MNVLKVIHGFPPDYMAGSEVYSFHLARCLSKIVDEISVFTTVENEFSDNYEIHDEEYHGIKVHRINKSRRDYAYKEKFFDQGIERLFRNYLKNIQPDIIHFGHLCHLSTNLLSIAKHEYKCPIVFTLHDFWLFCVKGQLINEKKEICTGPSALKCRSCSPYQVTEKETQKMLKHMKKITSYVDIFLVPSNTLRDFFIQQGIPESKLIYSKYGFNRENISYVSKQFSSRSKINFGFMGRIIPIKGIRVLIDAFQGIEASLSIYGKVGSQARFLEKENIVFKGFYNNENINQILQEIDVLIVPSIWLENSPLVIQEAFLAGIPVITSDLGGMKELVQDGINGFLFNPGSSKSLQKIVLKILGDPILLNDLVVSRSDVRCIKDDALSTYQIYKELLKNEA